MVKCKRRVFYENCMIFMKNEKISNISSFVHNCLVNVKPKYITIRPLVYHTIRPLVYHTIRPLVYHTIRPLVLEITELMNSVIRPLLTKCALICFNCLWEGLHPRETREIHIDIAVVSNLYSSRTTSWLQMQYHNFFNDFIRTEWQFWRNLFHICSLASVCRDNILKKTDSAAVFKRFWPRARFLLQMQYYTLYTLKFNDFTRTFLTKIVLFFCLWKVNFILIEHFSLQCTAHFCWRCVGLRIKGRSFGLRI